MSLILNSSGNVVVLAAAIVVVCCSIVVVHGLYPSVFCDVAVVVLVYDRLPNEWLDKCVDDVTECFSTQHGSAVGNVNFQCGELYSH